MLKALWKFISHRLFILSVIISILFSILLGRIFQLQIVEGKMHQKEFSINILKDIPLEGTRGKIYDRNGIPLAVNSTSYSLSIDASVEIEDDVKNKMLNDLITIIQKYGDQIVTSFPIVINENRVFDYNCSASKVTRFKKDLFGSTLSEEEKLMTAEDMFVYIKDKFNISEDYTDTEALDIISIRYALYCKGYYKYKPEVIAVNISDATIAEINEYAYKFPGVKIVLDPLRQYNYAEYFSHIIGYTGKINQSQLEELEPYGYDQFDIVGRMGIEKEMEIYLKGKDGTQYVEVDNLGRTKKVINTVPSEAGKDVFLTIDKDLQIQNYKALEQQIAKVLVEKIYTRIPSNVDRAYVLEDVFASLFKNNCIDLEQLAVSTDETVQSTIYNQFVPYYDTVITDIHTIFEQNATYKTHNIPDITDYLFDYLFDNPSSDGIIKTKSTNKDGDLVTTEDYKNFIHDKLGLKDFVSNNLSDDHLEKLKEKENIKDLIPQECFNYVMCYIDEEIIPSTKFKNYVYARMISEKRVSPINLCFLLIEQGIVSANEEEIQQLNRRTLSPLDFIKSKIINLDITPQQLAMDPHSGSVVVVDVKSGEVLSLVSYPSYDNNYFVNDFDASYYYSLLDDRSNPLFHRAIKEKNAPGSTFKMISAIAGLEEGVITKNEVIVDKGIWKRNVKVYGTPSCWFYNTYGYPHPPETVKTAIADSCNYFFYETAYRLSLDENGHFVGDVKGLNIITKYASMFGLDSRTGIELDEYKPQISISDAVRSAIGQASHNFTPVQIARYIATLANGGTNYELNLVDKITLSNGKLYDDKTPNIDKVSDFEPDNLEAVYEGMLQVTTTGTASRIFGEFPILVAGKTGTAQQNKKRPSHAIFTAFAPYDEPEIAVVVVIPFGYTAQNSGVVVREVINSYYELDKKYERISLENQLDN